MTSDVESRAAAGRWLRIGVAVALTLLVLAILLKRETGLGELSRVVRTAQWGWCALSVLASCIAVAIAGYRWQVVLRAMGFEIGYRRSLFVYLGTSPLGIVAPSRAHELLRAVAVRDAVPTAAAASSVLAERAIDVVSLLSIGTVCALFAGQWSIAGLELVALLGALVSIAVLANAPRRLSRLPLLEKRKTLIERLFSGFSALRAHPELAARALLSSLSIRLLSNVSLVALLIAFGASVNGLVAFGLWPIAVVIGLLPLTLAGMGTRDAAFLYLLTATAQPAIDKAAVLAATLGFAVVTIWLVSLVGIPFMFMMGPDGRFRRSS
jgi:hypothetical protein